MLAIVIGTGRDGVIVDRRARRRSRTDSEMAAHDGSGNARTTFVIGALLTLPEAIVHRRSDQAGQAGLLTRGDALVVIGFNLVMLVLLEALFVAFRLAPDSTSAAIERSKAWAGRHARRVATRGSAGIAAALVLKGIIGLAS